MSIVAIDTHEVVQELKAAGFTEAQAEAVTRVVRKAQDLDLTNLVTKTDLQLGLSEAKNEILKWILGSIGLQTVVILGAAVTLARLLLSH